MLQPYSWPSAILHLDANAFFASVMQAVNPKLKGKLVVVGAERGIATAISYEAKKFGITRGMLMADIKKLCPKVVILEGDYQLFSLFSQKMFQILQQYSPIVEEYSVDEGFLDIFGLRRPFHASYQQIAQKIQTQINQELGLPVSIGVSLTKSLAKLASGLIKPQGITLIPGYKIEAFLSKVSLIKVWGIGPSTAAYLQKFGIKTALQFVNLPESLFQQKQPIKLNKTIYEIWAELRGRMVYQINPEAKNHYQSISKTNTFRPPTTNSSFLWAHLQKNIENAFAKARQYGYFVKKMTIFLKTQQFRYLATEIKLTCKQQYPLLCREQIKTAFAKIYQSKTLYRTTGVILNELSQDAQQQGNLFDNRTTKSLPKIKALYQAISKQPKIDFGASLYLKPKPNSNLVREKTLPRFSLPMLEI